MELSSNFLKIDFPIDFQTFTKNDSYDWTIFNPLWFIPLCVFWYSARTSLNRITEKHAGRICTILHALLSVSSGFPAFIIISNYGEYIGDYARLLQSLQSNTTAIIFANLLGYTSVSFFFVDSFFVQKNYRRHHIAAIICWLVTISIDQTSRIHAMISLGFFELGALCVQFSRFFPNNLFYRTFFCVGYTFSRILLTYFHFFIFYSSTANGLDEIHHFIMETIINSSLIYLLYMNIVWTYSQWKLLIQFYHSSKNSRATEVDFFSAHQVIIGNAPSTSAPTPKKLD